MVESIKKNLKGKLGLETLNATGAKCRVLNCENLTIPTAYGIIRLSLLYGIIRLYLQYCMDFIIRLSLLYGIISMCMS